MTLPIIFVSYSQKDERQKNVLMSHLDVLKSACTAEPWHDGDIEVGVKWEEELFRVLDQSSIAILFITQNFLSSNYIMNKELPRLIARQQNDGLLLFPILARHCAWQTHTWLKKLQIRPYGSPIWRDHNRGPKHEALASITLEIYDLITNK